MDRTGRLPARCLLTAVLLSSCFPIAFIAISIGSLGTADINSESVMSDGPFLISFLV